MADEFKEENIDISKGGLSTYFDGSSHEKQDALMHPDNKFNPEGNGTRIYFNTLHRGMESSKRIICTPSFTQNFPRLEFLTDQSIRKTRRNVLEMGEEEA